MRQNIIEQYEFSIHLSDIAAFQILEMRYSTMRFPDHLTVLSGTYTIQFQQILVERYRDGAI